MNKKKMFVVFIMAVLGLWLVSFAITYNTYYLGPDIFQVREFDVLRIPNISVEKANRFNSLSISNISEEEFRIIISYPENVTNITIDELKKYPALEKAINGVDCIKPGSNMSLCKATSTEDFNKIKNFIDSKRISPNSCFKFEEYEKCYTFSFARP